ncbi:MAG: hypothetical protein LW823_08005 [Rickettsiales bacterium]|jgi:opacity protein-like surface antigen|nr:hypothetical protein [Rickettsiales bacterium]
MKRLLCCLLALFPLPAAAYDLDSPYITKGEMEIELKNRFDSDHRAKEDGYRRHVLGIGYAPSDWWAFELEGTLEKPADRGMRYRATGAELGFQLTRKGEYWLDVGAELGYGIAHQNDEKNTVETALLLGHSTNRWQHLLNIGLETETGSGRDGNPTPELAFGSKYELEDKLDIGLEYHADFGASDAMGTWSDQKHRFGPAVYGAVWGGRIGYEIGWLAGISRAAEDHVFKLNLEHEFSF